MGTYCCHYTCKTAKKKALSAEGQDYGIQMKRPVK